MDRPSIGFTIGDFGSVRDRQSATMSSEIVRLAESLAAGPAPDISPRVGAYAIDYAPLVPGALIDAEVDAELEAMLAASTVVHRNEGV